MSRGLFDFITVGALYLTKTATVIVIAIDFPGKVDDEGCSATCPVTQELVTVISFHNV